MANGGQINYSIKFNTDKKDLDQLQKLLRDITVQAAMPGQEADKSLQQASVTAERLLSIINKSFNQDLGTINVTKFNEELTKGNLTIANVKKGLEGVKGGASAFNLLSSSILGANVQLKTTNALLDRMAVTLKNTIRYGISSSLYNNFVNSFAKAYDYVVDLDKSLNDIRIVTGLSAEKMETFAVNANSAAKNLGASTLDYTNAALIYYQQGLSDQEVKARAEATVKAANVTGQSGREVSEQLTAVWNGYKVTAEETELYVDKLAAVAASTAADLEELSTGMSKVASAANIMGVDIDQLNAQLATVVSVTRQAPESVGTAFKTIYARMGDIKAGLDDETTLGNYTAKMAELGFNVLDANNNLRDMGEVIEEIGSKWNEMSREQQIALTRTMGGARQYNQLLALFDNWDMYIDALETSKNAAGELQREQDIYMDSTDAHLKQLKATWQDLYDSLLNTKEINPMIDLFKNMVQSLDNFVDAFGGGAKSIAAFGVVIANVFNKQISSAINNFVHNKTIAEQNMNAIALKQQQLTTGSTMSDDSSKTSPYDDAIEARTKSQEAHARQIMMIQHGINEERQKELIDMQNEIASLEEQATLIEKQAEANLKKVMGEEEYQKYLQMTFETEDERSQYWQQIRENSEKETNELTNQYELLEKELNEIVQKKAYEEDILDTEELIAQIKAKASKDTRKEIVDITKNLDLNKLTVKQKTQLLQALQKVVDKQKEEQASLEKTADAAEEVTRAKEEVAGINLKKDQMEADFDNMIMQGQTALSTSEAVMTLTSSLSSLAMSWSTINSLFQTWNDENATLGDKITQSITTVAFTLPTLITVYKNLKALSESYKIAKMKELALDELALGVKAKNIASTEAETLVTNLYNKSKTQGNLLTKDEIKNKLIEVGVIQEETAATGGATVAQNAFNASIWANPLTWIIALLAGAVAGLAAYAAHVKKAKEEQKKWNDEAIQTKQEKQTEISENIALYDSYLDMYKAYKQGTKSKDEMANATNGLVDIIGSERIEIAKLTGDYDTLTEAIIRNRKVKGQERIANSENLLKNYTTQYTLEDTGLGAFASEEENWRAFKVGYAYDDEEDVLDVLEKYGVATVQLEYKSVDEMLYDYHALEAAYDELLKLPANILQESETFHAVKDYLDSHKEIVTNTEKEIDSIIDEIIADNLIDQDFNSAEEFENYWIYTIEPLLSKAARENGFLSYYGSQDSFIDRGKEYLKNSNSGYNRMFTEAELQNTETKNATYYQQQAKLNQNDSEQYASFLPSLIEQDSKDLSNAQIEYLTGIEKKYKEYFDNLKLMYGESYRASDEYWTAIKDLEEQAEADRITNLQKAAEEEQETINGNLDFIANALENSEVNAEEYNKKYQELWEQAQADPENFNWNLLDDLDEPIDNLDKAEVAIESLKNELVDLVDNDYEIKLAIDADIQSDFDNITSEFERVSNAAGMIGEDFKVSAENLEELNAAFPGILEGMVLLEDGSAQLKQSVVRDSMETAQAQIKNDTDQTVAKLENQRNELIAKADAANAIADIAAKLAKGETMTAKDAATIKEKLQIIEQTNSENVAKDEQGYSKDVADTGAKNATSMTKSYQEAYMQMSKDSAQWAENSKKNMLVAMTGVGTATSGGFNTRWSISNTSGIVSSTNKSELKSTQDIGTDTNWAEVEKYYRDLANSYMSSANSTQGKIAEIRARNNKALNQLKGAGTGQGGSGSGGKSGKSGSSKDPKIIDLTENEVDRYHTINTLIEKTTSNLDKLENAEEKALGGDWVKNAVEQIKLLNQQVDNYKEKLKIAQGEQAELKKELASQGVVFNANGTVANYSQALTSQLAQLNALEAQYNSLSAAQQEQWDNNKIIDNAKESFNTFKENINRYDELISKFIPDIEKQIQDAIDEIVEKQIERFDKGIDLRLDIADAERDWNKFKTKVIDGIADDDIIEQTKKKIRDWGTYYNEAGTGAIQALVTHLNQQFDEFNKDISAIYGQDDVKEIEDLEKYYEELMTQMEAVFDLEKEIHEAYIDMMEEAQDEFDKHIKQYKTVSDLIEHDMKLIELVYGKESYSALGKYYDKQIENDKLQLDFQRQQVEFWQAARDAEEKGSDAWIAADDNLQNAQKELNDGIEKSVEHLRDSYVNAIDEILQNLNKDVTGGKGLDYINTEWTLINKEADQYLDTINQLFETQALENKYLDAIDQTDNIAAQKKLKAIMDEEISALKEKEKLTQYDIDRANKRYEIALKQIALEEAQQNKSTMRLRRDSQGNYRYEYVADNDAIDQAQDELDKLKNDLYNFDKNQYNNSLKEMYDTWVEYQGALKDAAQINDPEERAAKEALIKKEYGNIINNMLEENAVIRKNLEESAFEDLAALHQKDVEEYNNMLEDEKNKLMTSLVPAWDSGIQQMADKMNEEGGFWPTCKEAFDKLHKAQDTSKEKFEDMSDAAGISGEEIKEGLDPAIDATKALIEENDALTRKYGERLQTMKDLNTELGNMKTAFEETAAKAKEVAEQAHEILNTFKNDEADAYDEAAEAATHDPTVEDAINGNPDVSTETAAASPYTGDGIPSIGDPDITLHGAYHYTSYGHGDYDNHVGEGGFYIGDINPGAPYPYQIWRDGIPFGWVKQEDISGYDTGGYTGEWGNNGRLAMLHQKELVLNASDTENILNAVNAIRTLTNSVGIATLARLANLGAGGSAGTSGNGLEQNVHITATFPNATSTREIEDALLNLTNKASQLVGRR